MISIIKKLENFQKNSKNNYGLIKFVDFELNFLKKNNYDSNKNYLFIIPHKYTNKIFKKYFKDFILYWKKKSLKYKNIKIIKDCQIKTSFNNIKFDKIYLCFSEDLNISYIPYTFNFLWILCNNPDLIYFNKSNFFKNLLNNIDFDEFESRIITIESEDTMNKDIKINKYYYRPSLDNLLFYHNNSTIIRSLKKIKKRYKFKYKYFGNCSICYSSNNLLKVCCNQDICLKCYLLNRKKYGKCPFCRLSYNSESNINDVIFKNSFMYIYNTIEKINLDFICYNYYKKSKMNIKGLIFTVLINKSAKKKEIVFINIKDRIIGLIYNKYLLKFDNLNISSFFTNLLNNNI